MVNNQSTWYRTGQENHEFKANLGFPRACLFLGALCVSTYINVCVCVYIFIHMHARMHHGTHEDRGKSVESGSLSTMWDLWSLRIKFRSSGLSVSLVTELSFKKKGGKSACLYGTPAEGQPATVGGHNRISRFVPSPSQRKGAGLDPSSALSSLLLHRGPGTASNNQ